MNENVTLMRDLLFYFHNFANSFSDL